MSATSKKYFDADFKKKIWGEFLKEISGAKSKNRLVEILGEALTQKELILLEKRLAVKFLLKRDLSYRKIAEIADVCLDTVGFVKKGLKKSARIPRKYSAMSSQKKKKERVLLPPYGRGRWKPYFDAIDRTRP